MLRNDISLQTGRSVAQSRVQPSDRVTHYFRTGQLARATRQWHLEEMAYRLGLPENNVIREYGMPKLQPEPESVVYLVGSSVPPLDGEPVKIGYTRTLRNRLEALQPGSVKKLWLIAYREGGLALEREIHGRLFAWQIREDWFEMCDDIREEFSLPLGPARVTGPGTA